MNNVRPGTYRAKVTDHTIGESKSGTPYVMATFSLDNNEQIRWYGYLSEKAANRTLKALVTLGFTGNDPVQLADMDQGNMLPIRVSIVVEEEMFDGKTNARVKYINAASESTAEAAKVKLGTMNLKEQLAAIKAAVTVPQLDESGSPLPF